MTNTGRIGRANGWRRGMNSAVKAVKLAAFPPFVLAIDA